MKMKFSMGIAVSLLAVGSVAMVVHEREAEAGREAGQPSVTVSSSISSGAIAVEVRGADGVSCNALCCSTTSDTEVRFVYKTNGGQFLYVDYDGGTVSTSPQSIVQASSTPVLVDFSVVGADTDALDLLWHDPVVIVQTGSCGGSRDIHG